MINQPVTAIVVTYHTGPHLRECLYALDSDPDVSAIAIVDNGNPAEDQVWLKDFAAARAGVRVLFSERNLGFGTAVNLGAAGVRDGLLLIINPDAIIKRGSVTTLAEAAKDLTEPWVAGGKIFDVHGRESRGGRRRKLTLWRALTSFAGLNTWTLEKKPPPAAPIEVGAVSGALMLMSKPGFDQLGGFDEAYFLHVEDVDLCRRAWDAGGKVIYCPEAGALHYGATSDAPAKTVAAHKADSLAYYFRKFAGNPVERAIAAVFSSAIKRIILARTHNQG